MITISESEFARLVDDILNERDSIIKHNPIGTDEEVLLWMLLGCLASYLSLTELETPCFTGKPDAVTYRQAILFTLKGRMASDFCAEPHITKLNPGGNASVNERALT